MIRTTPVLLTGTLFALGIAAAEPRVTEAVLGEDMVKKPTRFEIVKPTNIFRPDTPLIACVFRVEGAVVGTSARSVWIAEDVGKAAPLNFKITERSIVLPFLNSGAFSLSKPYSGFPVGSYRLEIYFGDKLAKTLKFSVLGVSQ